jgi:hypothetical protein
MAWQNAKLTLDSGGDYDIDILGVYNPLCCNYLKL